MLFPFLLLVFTIITNSDPIKPTGFFVQAQGHFKQVQDSFIKKWDSQGAGNGQISMPHSIDIDLAGNVYVADSGNSRVQKFTSDGQFVTKWSYENIGGIESYADPHQIAIDSVGNVYVPDAAGDKVIKFDGDGKFITKWGIEGTGNGQFRKPHGVAVDSADNVYITDMHNSRVQKFDSGGNFITMWGTEGAKEGQFSQVIPGIDADYSNDDVYVVDKEGANVQKFSSSGKFITKWGYEGGGDGEFKEPEDVAVNSMMGTIYVTDTGNSRIQLFGINPQKQG